MQRRSSLSQLTRHKVASVTKLHPASGYKVDVDYKTIVIFRDLTAEQAEQIAVRRGHEGADDADDWAAFAEQMRESGASHVWGFLKRPHDVDYWAWRFRLQSC
jgi:hypothetical protein